MCILRSISTPSVLVFFVLASCSRAQSNDASKAPIAVLASTTSSVHTTPTRAQTTVAESPVLGKPAPDFTLKDLEGHDVSLASFRGKTIVLEWFNPGCPFVKAAHTKGSLKENAKKHLANGVVWLAINSSAQGKQGYDVATNVDAVKKFGLSHPILRDENGSIGRAYGATNTPNMFVIDKKGIVVYAGAIDNSPDGEGESPSDGKLLNYVDAALDDLNAGRPVKTPFTKPYGCSVKYGS